MDLNAYALEKWVESRLTDARQTAADLALRAELGRNSDGGVVARSWRALMSAAGAMWAGSTHAAARRRSSSATRA